MSDAPDGRINSFVVAAAPKKAKVTKKVAPDVQPKSESVAEPAPAAESTDPKPAA